MAKLASFIVLIIISFFSLQELSSQTNDEQAYKHILEAKKLRGEASLASLSLAQDICKSGCHDSIMGSLYRRMGVTYLQGRLGKKKALDYTNQAIEYFLKVYNPEHPKLFNCQYNKSVILDNLGRLDESAVSVLEALNSTEHSSMISVSYRDSIQVKYIKQLCRIYQRIGDYNLVQKYAERGLAIANKRWKEPHKFKANLIARLGYAHYNQHNYQAALPFFFESLRIDEISSVFSKKNTISRHQIIGLCYFYLGKLTEAQQHFNVVLQYYTSLSSEEFDQRQLEVQYALAYIYANFFILHTKQEDWLAAKQDYEQALHHARACFSDESDPFYVYLYKDRALLASAQGFYEEALGYCLKAKITALGKETEINSNTIFAGMTPYVVLEIIALEASLHEKTGNTPKAIELYQTYSEFIGLSRLRVRASLSKSFLIDSAKPVYEKAIALCLKEYERTGESTYLEQAFQFNAANKAVLLFEELQGEEAIQYSGIPEAKVQEEEKLRHRLIALQKEVASTDEQRLDSLNQILNEEQKNYDLLLRRMEQEYPSYYELKYAINQSVDLKQIQQKIAADQALVEYFIGEENLFVFLLQGDQIEVKQILIMEDWENNLLLLRELLTNSIEEDCEQQFIQLSHHFYNWLLAPAMAHLSKETINRLLIIPDGMLTLVPFETLLTRPITEISGAKGFLLEEFAISYSYSSRALLQAEHTATDEGLKLFAGFGMEYDDLTLSKVNDMGLGAVELDLSYQDEIECQSQLLANRDLGYLKYSDDEVEGISELLGGDTWINEEATKQIFMEQAANYEILHLAMHGTVDATEPLNSSLIFTYQDSSEFLLSAADIYTMDLNGQMVVLSACNTAAGNWSSGTGPMSLSRAFHYSGIPSVVASLWSIPDHSTASLMRLFYENLNEGLPKDVALQQAKISYLNDDVLSSPLSRDPAFWAGAVVIGDASPLDRPGFGNVFWWVLAGFSFLGLLFLGQRWKGNVSLNS